MAARTPHHCPTSAGATARRRRSLGAALIVTALLLAVTTAGASAADAPFEPISFTHLRAPAGFHSITQPVFTSDGKHVLVAAARTGSKTADEILLGSVSSKKLHCITCANGPSTRPKQTGILNPFPDGKRIFVGFEGVIQCAPSVLKCRRWSYLPYDLSASKAPGDVIPPGGAANTTQIDISQGAAPSISQDGVHIGFSNPRSDGFEEMVVAKLVRQSDKYVVTDPKVINPPGPASATDPNVARWSDSTGLYEFKSFTHGGRDATYVEAGQSVGAENPDVWEVNLRTGQRWRLTSNPDWDEDMAISPNGRTLAQWSNRTQHLWDWLGGLMPYRSFIDAPAVATEAGMLINTPNNLACGGPMWLLPASGDRQGVLAGEPVVDYVDRKVHVTTHVSRWPMWNRQSTMLALNTNTQGAGLFSGKTPPYAVIAKLTARKPTEPQRVVSSAVGSWAPTPADWHPAFGFNGTVTLHGRGGGTVTVHYGGTLGAASGSFSETYKNYSEDGKTFLNGTKTIDITGNLGVVHEVTNITMTGAHHGYTRIDLTITGGGPTSTPTFTGGGTTRYDGKTVTGPPSWLKKKGSCPARLPKEPRLKAKAKALKSTSAQVKVTASVAGVGRNERKVDTEPVYHALIRDGRHRVFTNRHGVARVPIARHRHRRTVLRVTAGDTLIPTNVRVR